MIAGYAIPQPLPPEHAGMERSPSAARTPGPRRTRRVGSYRDAIDWIANEDDVDWLDDAEAGSPSVTLCLVADVFGRTIEDATADLRAAIAKARGAA